MNAENESLYFISLTTDNMLRVMQRVATVFSRNRVNIEQMQVFSIKGNSTHFSIVVYCSSSLLNKVVKQLGKIIELHDIHVRLGVDVIE